MEHKIVKRVEKKSESVVSLKQQILRLQNKILSQENKILKLEQKVLHLEAENRKLHNEGIMAMVVAAVKENEHDEPP